MTRQPASVRARPTRVWANRAATKNRAATVRERYFRLPAALSILAVLAVLSNGGSYWAAIIACGFVTMTGGVHSQLQSALRQSATLTGGAE